MDYSESSIKSFDKSSTQKYTISKYKPLWEFDKYKDLSINQLRILYSYLALINPKSDELNNDNVKGTKVEIDVDWVINQWHLKRVDKGRGIIKAVQEWKDINVWTYLGKDVIDKKTNTVELTHGTQLKVFDIIEIEDNERAGKIIRLRCSDEFIKCVFPKGNYIEYDLTYINEFSSPKQITFYEILKDLMNVANKNIGDDKSLKNISYNTKNRPMLIGINTLIKRLQLDERYKSYKYLNSVFLKPCIEKIKEFTDLKEIEYGKYDKRCPYYNIGYEIRKDERDKKKGESNNFNIYFIIKKNASNDKDEEIKDTPEYDDFEYDGTDKNELPDLTENNTDESGKEDDIVEIKNTEKSSIVNEIEKYFDINSDGTIGKVKEDVNIEDARSVLIKHVDLHSNNESVKVYPYFTKVEKHNSKEQRSIYIKDLI